jgi:ferredoxin--NADP+ reductase
MQQAINPAAADKATSQTIISMGRLASDLFIFRTTRPQDYHFTPGQYSRLGLGDAQGSMVWRPFSVTSAPDDDFLEYYGVLVPGGLFSGLIGKLEAGATIWIERQLFGFMTADRFDDGEDLWLLATGTGIGPFISILRDTSVWKKFRNIVIAHGVKHPGDLSFRHILQEMQGNPRIEGAATLKIIEAVTRTEQLALGQLHGRLTALLDNGGLEQAAQQPLTAQNSRVMMCGNPAMIEDMRKLLHVRGLRPCRRALPGQFVTENYW